MKIFKKTQILMLSAVMLFFFASPAFSAMSTQTTSGEDLINVDKTAPGTKLSGPLTIYYADTEVAGEVDMYVFLRLRKGYNLYAFSTIIPGVDYVASNIDTMTGYIEDFIEDVVIPELYDGDSPPFAIKATDQEIQDDPNCNYCGEGNLYFAIMDIVIAVQD